VVGEPVVGEVRHEGRGDKGHTQILTGPPSR
jgi:hypothetical protein